MRMCHSQSVVYIVGKELRPLPEDIHANPGNTSGASTHDDCCPSRNHTSLDYVSNDSFIHLVLRGLAEKTHSGCDSDEARDHAIDCTDDAGFLVKDDIERCPGEKRAGGGKICVEDSNSGIRRSCVRILTVHSNEPYMDYLRCPEVETYTSVEAVPADPKDTGAHHHQQHVIRLEVLTIAFQAWTNPILLTLVQSHTTSQISAQLTAPVNPAVPELRWIT